MHEPFTPLSKVCYKVLSVCVCVSVRAGMCVCGWLGVCVISCCLHIDLCSRSVLIDRDVCVWVLGVCVISCCLHIDLCSRSVLIDSLNVTLLTVRPTLSPGDRWDDGDPGRLLLFQCD